MRNLTLAQELRLYGTYVSRLRNYDMLQLVWGHGAAHGTLSSRQVRDAWAGVAAENGERRLQMYLHVPFCEELCDFCVFYKRQARGAALADACDRFVDRTVAQLEFFAPAFRGAEFDAFSVGGGTPSVLSVPQMRRLFGAAQSLYRFRPDAYRDIEFRPSDATADKLRAVRELGFGVVHFGVQSADEAVLFSANRPADTADRVAEGLRLAREAGIPVVRAHAIMGLAGDAPDRFDATVRWLCALGFDDVFVYTLLTNADYVAKYFGADESRFETWIRAFVADGYRRIAADVPAGYRLERTSGDIDHTRHAYSLVREGRRRFAVTYDDLAPEGINLFGLGASARSYRYGRLTYDALRAPELGAFDPDAPAFEGERLALRDEMRRVAVIAFRDESALSERSFRARFGTGLAEAFPRAVAGLGALGALRREGDLWRYLERDLRKRLLFSLFFSGPARILRRLRPQDAADFMAACGGFPAADGGK